MGGSRGGKSSSVLFSRCRVVCSYFAQPEVDLGKEMHQDQEGQTSAPNPQVTNAKHLQSPSAATAWKQKAWPGLAGDRENPCCPPGALGTEGEGTARFQALQSSDLPSWRGEGLFPSRQRGSAILVNPGGREGL